MKDEKTAFVFSDKLNRDLAETYRIDPKFYKYGSVKRGLRNSDGTGVIAGVSKIGSVQGYSIIDGMPIPMDGQLFYRGISVEDIVKNHEEAGTFGFEEVAYLLLMGKLPTKEEFAWFTDLVSSFHALPDGFTEDMILRSPSRDLMNGLARSILALYSYDEDPDSNSVENIFRQSVRLIGCVPTIVGHAYNAKRHYFDGKSLYLHNPKSNLTVAENFLRLVRADKSYTEEEAHLLDLMLILQAEHSGGNNSTFVCRTLSSTGTDTYSAIAGAVGSLKGPLHGGANAKVLEMFNYIKAECNYEDDDALRDYLVKLLNKEAGDRSGKLYGFGHAVYTVSDPRAEIIRSYVGRLAEGTGHEDDYLLLTRIEKIGRELITELKQLDTPICINVDFYSGFAYSMLGIPEELFTPLFAISRITGWCAHRMEEVLTGERLVRPAYRSALARQAYVPMEER